jgi:hypothetical protein
MNSVERLREYCFVEQENYGDEPPPVRSISNSPSIPAIPTMRGSASRSSSDGNSVKQIELGETGKQGWPRYGSMEFQNIQLKYRPSDPSVLK